MSHNLIFIFVWNFDSQWNMSYFTVSSGQKYSYTIFQNWIRKCRACSFHAVLDVLGFCYYHDFFLMMHYFYQPYLKMCVCRYEESSWFVSSSPLLTEMTNHYVFKKKTGKNCLEIDEKGQKRSLRVLIQGGKKWLNSGDQWMET